MHPKEQIKQIIRSFSGKYTVIQKYCFKSRTVYFYRIYYIGRVQKFFMVKYPVLVKSTIPTKVNTPGDKKTVLAKSIRSFLASLWPVSLKSKDRLLL